MNAEKPPTPTLVRDLMSVGVPTCPTGASVDELAHLMLAKEVEGIVVLDEHGHAVGVVTQDELVQVYVAGDEGKTAVDVMRPDVPQVPPDIPLTAAAQIMQDLGVRVLFIMHHAGGIVYPAAMLSYKHFLRHMAAQDANELRDLGIKAERELPLATFLKRRDEARQRASYHRKE